MRSFPPRRVADSCSGSVSPRLPEDVAAFECFEVLSDCKKACWSLFPPTVAETLSLYLQVCAIKISDFEFYWEPFFLLGQNNRNKNANVAVAQSWSSFG